MKFTGQILKMKTENGSPIQYYLNLSYDLLHINALFQRKIAIRHIGYQCVSCGRDEPIFRMGCCKKCFFESPMANESILRPELSTAHLGIEQRDIEFERKLELQPHIVYLAYTGEVKVGVTRESQIPTRWIDQGATFALPIARTSNRYEAGVIEVELKKRVSDKTNWRKMLQNLEGNTNLLDFQARIQDLLPLVPQKFAIDGEICALDFPYEAPTGAIHSFNLNQSPSFEGVLSGVKGQYLSFKGGNFINLRSHEGYVIELETMP